MPIFLSLAFIYDVRHLQWPCHGLWLIPVLTLEWVRSTLQEFREVIFVLKETMGCQQHGLCGRHLLVNDNAGWDSNSTFSLMGHLRLPLYFFMIVISIIIVFEVWHLWQSAACLLFHTCRPVNLSDRDALYRCRLREHLILLSVSAKTRLWRQKVQCCILIPLELSG